MTKQEKHEDDVVSGMSHAAGIAEQLFGTQSNALAVREIYDYLKVAEEEEFAVDLKRVFEHAKSVNKTIAPTPEQVFDLFERIFEDEDEDEE